MAARPRIGVVIVAFNSADIIDECLETLFASEGVDLRVVVVDNRSVDASCAVVRDWASGAVPFRRRPDSPLPPAPVVPKPIPLEECAADGPDAMPGPLTLLRSPVNGGYGYAVNLGMRRLLADGEIDLFWVLNPDCVVPRDTAAVIASAGRDGNFSLMGGRTIYYERPDEIQTDGGTVSRRTGRCKSVHGGLPPETTPMPDPATIDYISGAAMVASRTFIDAVGLMQEHYFLYYEEVDWAFRRGDLPLRLVSDMIVYHRGGTTIGSGDTVRRATAFANYFNYRNRKWFVRQHMPARWPVTLGLALAKSGQLVLKGAPDEAWAVFTGALSLPAPSGVRARIADGAARARAFDRR